jgi:hypothetical protein
MEAIEFYKANATNVVNVPRPHHPEDQSGIAGVRRCEQAQFFAADAQVMSLADACHFAEAYAKYCRSAQPSGDSPAPQMDFAAMGHILAGPLFASTHSIRECEDCRYRFYEIAAHGVNKWLANFRQSSSLAEPGAESAEPGKLNNADKSGPSGDSTQPE